jgi:hypothetical protein
MTQTTPATDSHEIAGYVLSLAAHPGGVHSLHVTPAILGAAEIDALRATFPSRDEALAAKRNAWRFLASGGRIVANGDGTVSLVAPTVKLAPPAASTATKVSDPGLLALQRAVCAGGYIARGGHDGEAPVKVLQALAKRGHVDLDVQLHGRRKVVAGARISRAGRIVLLRATGADRLTYALSA